MDQVGESSGGCNPWPILEEDKTESDIFENWKVN